MSNNNKNEKNTPAGNRQESKSSPSYKAPDLKELEKEAEKERTRKPGSQSNSSDQHNNGRGGGK
jgi:hypothetical protein